MKIVSVVGARPQFIKCAPVSRQLRKEHQEILIHTGQHYDPDMSDIFFQELKFSKPDYNLGVGSGTHGKQTGEILSKVEEVLVKESPDIVLVYGDTNSTLAGALAASKLHIPVAHVEAGLRSFDRTMPEEINRVVTDHISDLLFCPTQTAVDNLAHEEITKGVFLTGDVMVDALQYNLKIARQNSRILEKLHLIKGQYLVMTVHRPANTDNKTNMTNILEAIGGIQDTVVIPVHLLGLGFWHLTNDRRALPLCIIASVLPDLIDKSLGFLFPLVLGGGKNGVPFPYDRHGRTPWDVYFRSIQPQVTGSRCGKCNPSAPGPG